MRAPELLRKWRKANKLTMGGAAALIGTTWDTWRRWEKGLNAPRVDTALRISAVTGMPIEAWEETKSPQIVKLGDVAA